MHLLVFPDPDQRVANQLANIFVDRHRREPMRDRILAIAHGDDLFSLERQKKEMDHLLPRFSGEATAPLVERALEFAIKHSHDP